MSSPRIGSLCSGYGGLELGLTAAVGGSVAWHVEYDKHPSAVLEARFPGVPNYGDVTTTDWTTVEPIDWLTAGYPCQPFSHAGKRKGSADERHLWPFVAGAIGALRPRRVCLENVAGHVSLGLDAVLWDLAALGYDAQWGVVRASAAGAPHGRARIFIVAADTAHHGHERARRARTGRPGPADSSEPASDPDSAGGEALSGRQGSARRRQPVERGDTDWGPFAPAIRRWEAVLGRPAPAPTERGRGAEHLSARFVEWMQGLPAGWVTDILPRSPALKCLGNGVVPQQAVLALSVLLRDESQESALADGAVA